jgi:hypothetical protein
MKFKVGEYYAHVDVYDKEHRENWHYFKVVDWHMHKYFTVSTTFQWTCLRTCRIGHHCRKLKAKYSKYRVGCVGYDRHIRHVSKLEGLMSVGI